MSTENNHLRHRLSYARLSKHPHYQVLAMAVTGITRRRPRVAP